MHGDRTHSTYFSIVAAIIWMVLLALPSQAQTFTVLHNFTGAGDGATPGGAGLSIDQAGALYGTTGSGAVNGPECLGGCGTVFKLSHRGQGWLLSTLYSFQGGADGATPDAPVAFGSDGEIYGTTYYGAGTGCGGNGCGIAYRLRPPQATCRSSACPWTETNLHSFTGGSDGGHPAFGPLIFDRTGNIYGTTAWGGDHNYYGNVFELESIGGNWVEYVLYGFTGGYDGGSSWSGVISDSQGNLYGTTSEGGIFGYGTIFQLSPTQNGWTETVLHSFNNSDGYRPMGPVIMDSLGNLYGTTEYGGRANHGTAWELSSANGSWTLTTLYEFADGGEPAAGVTLTPDGTLYGTTTQGGAQGAGNVFKLAPSQGGWTYTSLHDFSGSDGFWPYSRVTLDAAGNLYGTTEMGGQTHGGICGDYGCGVVWEITP